MSGTRLERHRIDRAGAASDPRGGRALALVAGADALAALALLLLNDRVLKGWAPGGLTGKLSDLAGLYLFPLVLVAIYELATGALGRRPASRRASLAVAGAATVVAFAAIKLNPLAGEAFRVVFGTLRWPLSATENLVAGEGFRAGNRVTLVRDPADLVALPAVGLAWYIHGRGVATPTRS